MISTLLRLPSRAAARALRRARLAYLRRAVAELRVAVAELHRAVDGRSAPGAMLLEIPDEGRPGRRPHQSDRGGRA